MLNFFSRFKHFDIPLQISILLLISAGLAVLYSTSVAGGTLGVFWRQLVFLSIGLVAFVFFAFFDYHALAKTNRIIYVIFILLLVYLIVLGSAVRGGKRWIDVGIFRFQVAEFVKISIILGLSRLLYLRRGEINSWKNIIWSFLYVLIPAGLIILEPDLGSAAVLISIWAGVIFLSPIKKKYLAILFIVGIIASGLGWKFALKDFQKNRILVFINPALDPKGRGYNVRQAAIAVGSGQIFGRGLGQGLQSENKFLPEQQTDFIFAAASEEIGFVGVIALLGLYLFLFYRLLIIIRNSRDDLGMYIAGGIFFLFFSHLIVNIGMNIGLLPVTGIPLPFFSAGGSSLVVVLILLGIAQNIAVQSKTLRF